MARVCFGLKADVNSLKSLRVEKVKRGYRCMKAKGAKRMELIPASLP